MIIEAIFASLYLQVQFLKGVGTCPNTILGHVNSHDFNGIERWESLSDFKLFRVDGLVRMMTFEA